VVRWGGILRGGRRQRIPAAKARTMANVRTLPGVLLIAVLTSFACAGEQAVDGLAGPAGGSPPASVSTSDGDATTTANSATATATSPPPTATVAPPSAIPTPARFLSGIDCEPAAVLAITDGDTFSAEVDGVADDIRLIGVDSPERGQPLSGDASAALAELAGAEVCLERDVTERDAFGRLLRYAWRSDGTLINEEMVERGLALVVTYPPDEKYVASRYRPAESRARAANLGLWATLTPAPTAGTSDGQCDPSYPDFCIPPASVAGDLDCGDVNGKRFTVLQPDPHNFDRDLDGIGCES
jgi:micrococcal nuclease